MRRFGWGLTIFGAWFLVMGSALSVVYVTHQTRAHTQQLERLRHNAADLHAESGKLLLEKSTLASFARVEQLALQRLDMTVPNVEHVVLLKP